MTVTSANPRSKPQIRWDEGVIEDIEWLIEVREWPPNIIRRIGIDPVTLVRQLQRHGREDLAKYFNTVVREARHR